jgi:FemAB-related protein (PEP-CTERM system-associated)
LLEAIDLSRRGPTTIRVDRRVTPIVISVFNGAAAEWDGFVRSQPGWTHFHLHGWRTVIERVFGHQCIYLVTREQSSERIVAAMPLVRVRSLIFGHYLVSMPFLNYGGPLGSEEGVQALALEAVAIAERSGVDLLELRSRTPLPIALPVSHRKLTVVLELPTDSEALWGSLPAKLRSQIRRPRKEGVDVRFGADQIGPFYRVFAEHMRDLGTPVLPKTLFEMIAAIFPEDVQFAVAYHAGRPVACGCGLLWNGEFEITWASALRSHRAMSPNMLVYWALMERMVGAGARLFNFGRCSPDSGTHRFKMQWGGREERLWWYQRSSGDAHDAKAHPPSQDEGIFALASRAWKRLPVTLATRLGPTIVRYIP